MKTFKNLKVGVLETVNDELAKQYEARPNIYALVETGDKTNEPTLKELKEQADALGIEYKASCLAIYTSLSYFNFFGIKKPT